MPVYFFEIQAVKFPAHLWISQLSISLFNHLDLFNVSVEKNQSCFPTKTVTERNRFSTLIWKFPATPKLCQLHEAPVVCTQEKSSKCWIFKHRFLTLTFFMHFCKSWFVNKHLFLMWGCTKVNAWLAYFLSLKSLIWQQACKFLLQLDGS